MDLLRQRFGLICLSAFCYLLKFIFVSWKGGGAGDAYYNTEEAEGGGGWKRTLKKGEGVIVMATLRFMILLHISFFSFLLVYFILFFLPLSCHLSLWYFFLPLSASIYL